MTTEGREGEERTLPRSSRMSVGRWTSRGVRVRGRHWICPTDGHRWIAHPAGVSLPRLERRHPHLTPDRWYLHRPDLLRDHHRLCRTLPLGTERLLHPCPRPSLQRRTTQATRRTRPSPRQPHTLEVMWRLLRLGLPLRHKDDRSGPPLPPTRRSRPRRARLSCPLDRRKRLLHRGPHRQLPTRMPRTG